MIAQKDATSDCSSRLRVCVPHSSRGDLGGISYSVRTPGRRAGSPADPDLRTTGPTVAEHMALANLIKYAKAMA